MDGRRDPRASTSGCSTRPEKQAERHPEHELELALRDGRYEEEGWRVRKDGSRFWAHVTITTVRDAERTPRRLRQGHPRRHRRARGPRPARGGERTAAPGRRGPGPFPGDDHARAAFAGRSPRQYGEARARALGPPRATTSARSCSTGWPAVRVASVDCSPTCSPRRVCRAPRSTSTSASSTWSEQLETDRGQCEQVGRRRRRGPVGRRTAGARPGGPDRLAQIVENLVGNGLALRRGARRHHRRAVRGGAPRSSSGTPGEGISEGMQARLFQRFATGRQGRHRARALHRARARAGPGWRAAYRTDDQAFVVTLPTADDG